MNIIHFFGIVLDTMMQVSTQGNQPTKPSLHKPSISFPKERFLVCPKWETWNKTRKPLLCAFHALSPLNISQKRLWSGCPPTTLVEFSFDTACLMFCSLDKMWMKLSDDNVVYSLIVWGFLLMVRSCHFRQGSKKKGWMKSSIPIGQEF
jgi:hypothetical protein